MTELDAKTFAVGVHDAIRAARNVYGAVRQMREEIKVALEQPPTPPLFDLGIRAEASNRHHPEEKILRSWEGRFYGDNPAEADGEPEDEDDDLDGEPDEEESPKRRGPLVIVAGQRLAYIKTVIFQAGGEAAEPHILYGVLHNARVGCGWPEIEVRRYKLQEVFALINAGRMPGELRTRIRAQPPKGVAKPKGKDMSNRLVFDLRRSPERVPLFDVQGPQQIREIADGLKRLWADIQ